jgi:hypothetical protein
LSYFLHFVQAFDAKFKSILLEWWFLFIFQFGAKVILCWVMNFEL